MKKYIVICLVLLYQGIEAQDFSQSYDVPASVKEIFIDSKYGNIEIVSAPINNITVKGEVEINLGTENDAYKVTGEQDGNRFIIKTTLNEEDIEKAMVVKYKNGTKRIFYKDEDKDPNNDEDEDRKWVSYGIDVEVNIVITIPQDKNLSVKSIYGSISVENMRKDVDIRCTYGGADLIQSSLYSTQNILIESTYGHVDVSVPVSVKADLSIKASYGSIYSNHDIKPNLDGSRDSTPFGENVKTKLNGGGNILKLESGYSNVYLRKT
jgi:hypothetical protein